jgi:hypothetical protein
MLLYVCPHAIYMCLHPAICVLILLYLHERVAVILLVVEPHDGADVLGPEHVRVKRPKPSALCFAEGPVPKLRQYLYFFTITSIKLSTFEGEEFALDHFVKVTI